MENHVNPRTSAREEYMQKLNNLYPDAINYERNFLDFHSGYQFFTNDDSSMLKFNSQWFDPKHKSELQYQSQNIIYEKMKEDGIEKKIANLEPKQAVKTDDTRTINLHSSGGAPCQIEIGGEKFQVVYATLQKCDSTAERKGVYFTSKGLIEAPVVKKSVIFRPANFDSSKEVTNQSSSHVPKLVPLSKEKVESKIVVGSNKSLTSTFVINPYYRVENPKRSVIVLKRKEPEVTVNKSSTVNTANKFSPIQITIRRNGTPYFNQTRREETSFSKQAIVSEEENRSSSPSTDTGDEEINPQSFKEPPFNFEEVKLTASDEQPEKKLQKVYDCKDCSKCFSSQQLLDEHVSSHQKELSELLMKKVASKKKQLELEKSPPKEPWEEKRVQAKPSPVKSVVSSSDHVMATSKFGRRRSVLNFAKFRNDL